MKPAEAGFSWLDVATAFFAAPYGANPGQAIATRRRTIMSPDEEPVTEPDPDTEPEDGDPQPPVDPEDPSQNEGEPFVQGG